MLYDEVVTYGCDPADVAPARQWIETAISRRLPQSTAATSLVDDAVLVVSELLTNAIRASCSQVSVGMSLETDAVRIGVCDDAGGTPRQQDAGPAECSGRGLTIVAAVSRQWGVRPTRAEGVPGKEVWARLSLNR